MIGWLFLKRYYGGQLYDIGQYLNDQTLEIEFIVVEVGFYNFLLMTRGCLIV